MRSYETVSGLVAILYCFSYSLWGPYLEINKDFKYLVFNKRMAHGLQARPHSGSISTQAVSPSYFDAFSEIAALNVRAGHRTYLQSNPWEKD